MPEQTLERITKRELLEYSIARPFNGVQGDSPVGALPNNGFWACNNVLISKNLIVTKPQYELLSLNSGSVKMLASFEQSDGDLGLAAVVGTSLLGNTSGAPSFSSITGSLSADAGDSHNFDHAVVNHNLLFCQGVDKVQAWDGGATFGDVDASAVAAFHLAEIGTHLVVGRTVESATEYPQRIRWTAAGDPTDWTGQNAGINDLLNKLGRITGLSESLSEGVVFHRRGITQIIRTGLGLRPFDFVPYASAGRGTRYSYTPSQFGQEGIAYVGQDNVYLYNGSSFDPIGRRGVGQGAWAAIQKDLFGVSEADVKGVVVYGIAGIQTACYCIIIAGSSSSVIWVYDFFGGSWFRWTVDARARSAGWLPRTSTFTSLVPDLNGVTPHDSYTHLLPGPQSELLPLISLGLTGGDVVSYNFAGSDDADRDWEVVTDMLDFGWPRHTKRLNQVRIRYLDIGEESVTATVKNERGETSTDTVTIGNSAPTGQARIANFKMNISGAFHSLKLSGDGSGRVAISEITFVYVPGGEYK